MKKILAILSLSLLAACGTQQATQKTAASDVTKPVLANADEKVNRLPQDKIVNGHLYGVVEKSDFNQAPFAAWFNPRYEEYTLDEDTKKALKKGLKNVKIRAYMGTWCGDSKRETPKFYKLLDEVNYDLDDLQLITVDRSKSKPAQLVQGFDIKRVPTFIFYKKGKEIGRYVERPRESLETDILKIVTGQEYKHSYDN